jgi:pyruvate/2-oxoglutarate dehydrogenase complex dihydrolipoamide dehydrogenase (E3) component
MIAPVIVAMSSGLKVHDLASAIYPYPTLSDGIQNAAQAALDAQKK